MSTLNRFEWLKAVMQVDGLTPTAKNVATAIAVQFANDETGQINPSQETLADYLKVHRDTIKRVLRELRAAGWIMATGDGGRGKAPLMRLISPGQIVPFHASKRGGKSSPDVERRGGEMFGKGGQITPSHIRKEQSLEHKDPESDGRVTAITDHYRHHRFVGSVTTGLRLVLSSDFGALNRWAAWLEQERYPKLCDLPIGQKAGKKDLTIFALPGRYPPTCETSRAEAVEYLTHVLDVEASRHAAQ